MFRHWRQSETMNLNGGTASRYPLRFLLAVLLLAAGVSSCTHRAPGKPIALSYAAPYAAGVRVRPAIRRECDLERKVVDEIASEIRGQFQSVRRAQTVGAGTPGLALELKIVGVEGKRGAAPGHKSLTVAGTLYENGTVIGNFIAMRKTKRGRHTCRMLHDNIEEIAEDISRWLEAPGRDAFLGDARPGDGNAPDVPLDENPNPPSRL